MNPYIVSRPANEIQVQKLGDTVRLNCSASGSPLPKIIWLTDGRKVHSLVVHGGIDLTESELTIYHFKPTDAGMYTCLFYNEKNATADAKTSLSMFFVLLKWSLSFFNNL